ncbi:Protein SnodProt1-like protein [Hapsidospora chrysogenum ATCC 11550]|uniref:Protein SnodProt1-like protein n=1 Tax=Hapsidospora chrysogenum (strain ATCC 11550 / CBS 779.69 / DSM 880 / IAM 14645 / JCM 23072 / IMI 49137) TaxID=857340 RepID=A0A086T978_HAPC1|nr:Protein SnodProt1-like protein [Hapsidospora chrysogenum ATCC 11550]
MQLSSILSIFSLAALAPAATVSYDPAYDDPARSLTEVACSNGDNGLITRFGWRTLAEVANFPRIGGAVAVGGWNSPSCGTCWRLEWRGNVVNVLAVDHDGAGYNIGLAAMNSLTNNRAVELGRVEAVATQANVSACGINT